uniref:Uncharacterized protein n=1 Tax=Strigamia maritima TaxID=126957 RepID=T1IWJ4_STRMM
MDFDGRNRYDDAPPNNHSGLVTCPHCRGMGIIQKTKLSSGQIRKIEADETGETPKRPPLLDLPPSAPLAKPASVSKEILLYQKTDTLSDPGRKQPFDPRRNSQHFERGPGGPANMPDYDDYLRNDPGPSRSKVDFFRRSDYADWHDNYDDIDDDWAGNGDHWRSGGGGQTWRDHGDKYDDFPGLDDEFGKKKKRKKQRANRMKNFGNDEFNVGLGPGPARGSGPGLSNDYPPFDRQPRSLMSDRVIPPMPGPSAAGYMHQGSRKRPWGSNSSNMPGRDDGEELSNVDIFSLGVLYGNYMK